MSRRMLIVDDEAVLRKHLARLFAQRGYEVSTAGSCAEALEALDRFVVETLLLDVKLPDGDGLVLLAQIGEHRRPRHTILMTAFCSAETELRARELNVRHVLRKPLDLVHLLGALPKD
jgi:DNA-binding response OmpR family regulator